MCERSTLPFSRGVRGGIKRWSAPELAAHRGERVRLRRPVQSSPIRPWFGGEAKDRGYPPDLMEELPAYVETLSDRSGERLLFSFQAGRPIDPKNADQQGLKKALRRFLRTTGRGTTECGDTRDDEYPGIAEITLECGFRDGGLKGAGSRPKKGSPL